MGSLTEPPRPRARRVGIMADGRVGRDAVELLLKLDPTAAAALVTVDRRWPDLRLPPSCKRFAWAEMNTPSGLQRLRAEELDVLILAWWPHLLRSDLLTAAPIVLNMHPSHLPSCRGKDPNFWALVEGSPYGVTIHHVTAGIDAGDIAFQRAIPTSWEDTGGSLYEKALAEMVLLFEDSLPLILHGEIPRRPQSAVGASLHFRRELEPASLLSLDEPMRVRRLLNLLRARTFSPHPACRFEDDGAEYEVRVEITRLS